MHLRVASSSAALDDTLRGLTERMQVDVESLSKEMAALNQTATAVKGDLAVSSSSGSPAWSAMGKAVGAAVEVVVYSVLRGELGLADLNSRLIAVAQWILRTCIGCCSSRLSKSLLGWARPSCLRHSYAHTHCLP